MIETLRIRNFAIVESEELDFGPGLNVITGETWVGDIPALHADISKIRAKGFEPKVRLDEGIRRLLGSYGLDLPLSG